MQSARINHSHRAGSQRHVIHLGTFTGIDGVLRVEHHLSHTHAPDAVGHLPIRHEVERDAALVQFAYTNRDDLVPDLPDRSHDLFIKKIIRNILATIAQITTADPAPTDQALELVGRPMRLWLAIDRIQRGFPPLRRIVPIRVSVQNLINGFRIKPRLPTKIPQLGDTHNVPMDHISTIFNAATSRIRVNIPRRTVFHIRLILLIFGVRVLHRLEGLFHPKVFALLRRERASQDASPIQCSIQNAHLELGGIVRLNEPIVNIHPKPIRPELGLLANGILNLDLVRTLSSQLGGDSWDRLTGRCINRVRLVTGGHEDGDNHGNGGLNTWGRDLNECLRRGAFQRIRGIVNAFQIVVCT